MSYCLQPAAIEWRYVCRVHQRNQQISKRDRCASARGRLHHASDNLTSSNRPTDVGNKTTSGRHVMTGSSFIADRPVMTPSMGQLDDAVERTMEDHDVVMQEAGKNQLADSADVDEEPIWILRSPYNSTSNGSSRQHRRYASAVNSTGRQLAPEVLSPDDNIVRRRTGRNTKDDATSGCHRAHALFVWKRAIVEWRAMSAVIDRLLFVVFLVATVVIYLVILVVLPPRSRLQDFQ